MEKMIAHCGQDCKECDAYKATANNNNELRRKTAKEWSEMLGKELKPEDIKCMGCRSTSEAVYQQVPVCKIRACALEKRMETCADCDSYICGALNEFYSHGVFWAKDNLDEIRKNRSK